MSCIRIQTACDDNKSGGNLFDVYVQMLESENELTQCKNSEARYLTMEETTAQKLWSIGQSYFSNIEDSQLDESLDNVRTIVQQYSADVIEFSDAGYDGRNCSLMGTDDGVEYDWSLVGSMLFAITVYTTVGLCQISCFLFIYWVRLPQEPTV